MKTIFVCILVSHVAFTWAVDPKHLKGLSRPVDAHNYMQQKCPRRDQCLLILDLDSFFQGEAVSVYGTAPDQIIRVLRQIAEGNRVHVAILSKYEPFALRERFGITSMNYAGANGSELLKSDYTLMEIGMANPNKGTGILFLANYILEPAWDNRATVIFIGNNDSSEEPMAALGTRAMTIRWSARNVQTHAQVRLTNLNTVLAVLEWVNEL